MSILRIMRLGAAGAAMAALGWVAAWPGAAATHTPIAIGTNGSPRGYWEFLPTAYAENPEQEFPLVVFLHGLGEGGNGQIGNGTTQDGVRDLDYVLGNGPPEIVNAPPPPEKPENQLAARERVYRLLESSGVVVLSPQYPTNTWWSGAGARAFLNYALAHYRIDRRRIYMTGLSAGAGGIQDLFNSDAQAEQLTAVLLAAVRGQVNDTVGAAAAARVPYWGLMAIGDGSTVLVNSANRIAGHLLGTGPTDVMSTYPGNTATRTAHFHPASGWVWLSGAVATDDKPVQMTLYPGSSHNSWDAVYTSLNCWTWLLAQQKPDITITSPASGTLARVGSAVVFTAVASDADGQSILGESLEWFSSLDGFLDTGESIEVDHLRIGVHTITCRATDAQFRRHQAQVAVTVLHEAPFTAHFDFGTIATTGAWNNVTDRVTGSIANAVGSDGQSVGVSLQIVSPFEGVTTSGVASSALYPVTAQQDGFYVGATVSRAEIRVGGLDPARTYDFTFFGSRATGGDRTALYTIHGQTVSLSASNNASTVASITDVGPSTAGEVMIAVEKTATAIHGYLGVITIVADPLPEMTFPVWAAEQGLQGADAAAAADPDGDGLPNLAEYLFGSLPLQSATAVLAGMIDIGPDRYLAVTFGRNPAAHDVNAVVERSSDLAAWTAVGAITGGVCEGPGFVEETVAGPNRTARFRDTVPMGTEARAFLRVKVVLP